MLILLLQGTKRRRRRRRRVISWANTCPLCRTEFPTGDSIANQNLENEMIESTELEPILPQSLIPSVVNTLNPEQVSGLRDNEDNE